ncbi:MAG: hypothetical protein QOE28_1953, partial [Solirubrobacteraceae bacterium]|nr:hypothetical protein [Solirubrobacteraceae bacterium]
MSPLLTSRPTVSVTRRLLAACAVTALLGVVVALGAGTSPRATGAAPASFAAGAICAALVAYLLYVSARAVTDVRLRWMAAGATVACLGLLANLMGLPTLFPGGGPATQGADAMSARYVIWHGALASAGVLALLRVPARRGRVLAFLVPWTLLLVYSCAATAPFGHIASGETGYSAAVKIAVTVLALTLAGVATTWWRSEARTPTWGAVCVVAALGLSAADCVAYLLASQPYDGAWWASLTLRAGQFAIPAVGLVMGFVGLADRLRDLQDELGANLRSELERAQREDALSNGNRTRRERQRARVRRLISGAGLDVALQPIVDLISHEVVGAEALARFTDADGHALPTEALFLDAHALGLGIELELAAVELALASQDRLPEGLYLALNVSPALLASDALRAALAPHRDARPLVVELTEHQPVEDYSGLAVALGHLREMGIRVAIDDVGSGFASFRHVTRVNPEILKLDRTL